MAKKLFDKERALASRVRDHVSNLKPLRFTSDALKAEIEKGGKRADDIITLILYVEDLSVALTEVIAEAEDTINAMRQMVVGGTQPAQKQRTI